MTEAGTARRSSWLMTALVEITGHSVAAPKLGVEVDRLSRSALPVQPACAAPKPVQRSYGQRREAHSS